MAAVTITVDSKKELGRCKTWLYAGTLLNLQGTEKVKIPAEELPAGNQGGVNAL